VAWTEFVTVEAQKLVRGMGFGYAGFAPGVSTSTRLAISSKFSEGGRPKRKRGQTQGLVGLPQQRLRVRLTPNYH